LLHSEQNDAVSDTTKADKGDEADNKNIDVATERLRGTMDED
jgi:hypothetical protein